MANRQTVLQLFLFAKNLLKIGTISPHWRCARRAYPAISLRHPFEPRTALAGARPNL